MKDYPTYSRQPVSISIHLKDGLYRIVAPRKNFVAGFVVKDRLVIDYAPILFKLLALNQKYWLSLSEWISE